MTPRLRSRAAVVLGLALAGAPPAEAQPRWVEAVGVARAEPGEGRGGAGRAAALRAALGEAVQQVGVELVTASEAALGRPASDPAVVAEKVARALGGGDPTAYVSRFQIREDRGVQPRLLLGDPEAKAEYQLVVSAQVDVAKVRQRLGVRALPPSEAGASAAVAPGATAPGPGEASAALDFSTYDLELEALSSYREYASVREALLGRIGARRVAAVEFTRGRAVLSIDSPVPAPQLAAALGRALQGQLEIEPLAPAAGAPEGRLRLRVRALPVQPPAPGGLTR